MQIVWPIRKIVTTLVQVSFSKDISNSATVQNYFRQNNRFGWKTRENSGFRRLVGFGVQQKGME